MKKFLTPNSSFLISRRGLRAMAKKLKPEVVAVITAAVQAMCKGGKVVAVKVKRNENWTLASRNRN